VSEDYVPVPPAEYVPVPLPAHEAHTAFGLSAYLDSAAGQALVAAHRGDRAAAANSLYAQAQADQAWRRQQAQEMFDRNPARYPGGVGEALSRVGPPPGPGIQLSGTSEEIEKMSRRVDPLGGGFRVIAPEAPDNRVTVGTKMDSYGLVIDDPELTRGPWQH
jgi:hypothetical protein